ncbi:hypothetical protein BS47DRAFT_1367233 [Hydnum rufescens UP504]|uniref:Uncharacterized protein n=1 Tax=Hydnum rufescens UP504 TaxID=1448309 RepID=A0A9P6DQG2_9AGAM|nr:hypothetical protein BS47DRAFT_1367233 [Hydnum rufescens UP504]
MYQLWIFCTTLDLCKLGFHGQWESAISQIKQQLDSSDSSISSSSFLHSVLLNLVELVDNRGNNPSLEGLEIRGEQPRLILAIERILLMVGLYWSLETILEKADHSLLEGYHNTIDTKVHNKSGSGHLVSTRSLHFPIKGKFNIKTSLWAAEIANFIGKMKEPRKSLVLSSLQDQQLATLQNFGSDKIDYVVLIMQMGALWP